jgi:hypothetical protein
MKLLPQQKKLTKHSNCYYYSSASKPVIINHHHHHHHQEDLSKLLEKTPKCSDPTCTLSFLYTKKTVDPTPPTTPTN